jgi:hypothetical protein
MFKHDKAGQVMVSPNVSQGSDSHESLNKFIDDQCKQNFVINGKLSTYKSDSDEVSQPTCKPAAKVNTPAV